MATENKITKKGFIKDFGGNILLPITRAELVLDSSGMNAFHSNQFCAIAPDASIGSEGLPGLMTAAEKQLLNTLRGDTPGDSSVLASIYSDLNTLFNISLYVDNTELKLYSDKNQNKIKFSSTDSISLVANEHTVSIGLNTIHTKSTEILNTLLTGIKFDEFGRVIDVQASNTIDELTLEKGSLTTVQESDTSLVNKKYVDTAVNAVQTVATGALKFNSVIQDQDQLNTVVANVKSSINSNNYYKVGFSGGIINDALIMIDGVLPQLKIGDTLISYTNTEGVCKLAHIPSGDETTTSVKVLGGDDTGTASVVGDVTLRFNNPFVVESQDNKAIISLPVFGEGVNTASGLISATDYQKFLSYSSKSASYNPTVTNEDADAYEIGQIGLDNGAQIIYGKNTTYNLSVLDGYPSENAAPVNDPKLCLTSNTADSQIVQFKGENGITVYHDSNTINIKAPNLGVDASSQDFLSVNGNSFKVNLGAVIDGEIQNGLVDLNTLGSYLASFSAGTVKYESIENALTEESGNTYYYGSGALVSAISFDK